MLPYAETLMPRWKKLTVDSMPAPFHFSNFEESVLDRSVQAWELSQRKSPWKHLQPATRALFCIGIPGGLPHEGVRIGIKYNVQICCFYVRCPILFPS